MTHTEKDDLVERLNAALGGLECPKVMNGDNLSIVLCTAFDDGGPDLDEYGWSEAAVNGCHATLQAIKDHYAPLATRISALERELAEAREALRPFAEQANTHSDKMPDEMFIDDYEQPKGGWVSHARLRVGDLRRAARALETTKPRI